MEQNKHYLEKKVEEINDDDEEEEYNDNCVNCNGSGEGMWDGSFCMACGGSGVGKIDYELED